MKPGIVLVAGAAALFATSAMAHKGVKNPAVKARMDSMAAIAANTKILGQMAKGVAPFDAAAAQKAAAGIADGAAKTPALFEAQETDPMSEALPAIWTNFPDFAGKAAALEGTARAASMRIETPEDLRAALGGIGQACKACHADYRK